MVPRSRSRDRLERMEGSGTVRVADLRDGETVRVRGRARRAGELLTSSLGGRACVYWEVRAGLDCGRSRRATL